MDIRPRSTDQIWSIWPHWAAKTSEEEIDLIVSQKFCKGGPCKWTGSINCQQGSHISLEHNLGILHFPEEAWSYLNLSPDRKTSKHPILHKNRDTTCKLVAPAPETIPQRAKNFGAWVGLISVVVQCFYQTLYPVWWKNLWKCTHKKQTATRLNP